MNDNSTKRLQEILAKYDAKKKEKQIRKEQHGNTHAEFLKVFAEKADNTIRPAMESIGKIIEGRGHQWEIMENDEELDRSTGRIQDAMIRLIVYPSGRRPRDESDHAPSVAFRATGGNAISVYRCTMMPGGGGSAGPGRSYKITEITGEAVEDEILGVLSEAMTGWQAG